MMFSTISAVFLTVFMQGIFGQMPSRDRDSGNVLTRAAATDACYWLQIVMANDVAKSKACLTTVNSSITTPQSSTCKSQILSTIIGGRNLIIKHTNNIMTCIKNNTIPFNIGANYTLKACQANTGTFVAYSRTMSAKPSTVDSVIKIGNVVVPQCLLDVKMGVNPAFAQLADCCTKCETCDVNINAISRSNAIKAVAVRNVQLNRLHEKCVKQQVI